MKMCLWAVSAAMMAAITGCAGYQYGDITTELRARQAAYCLATDPEDRALRVAAIRAMGAPLPPSGACTDIVALVSPEELIDLGVDLEQAREDQRRFEEQYPDGVE